MRAFRHIIAVAACWGALLSGAAAADAPQRVVSMNVCTDQLAMLLADEGQLISISMLARDPRTSAMHEEAKSFPVNHGRAEEVFLLKPDLVIGGTYTSRASVALLEQFEIPVALFSPVQSVDDIPDAIRGIGKVLGREIEAERLVADFEMRLANLRSDIAERPRAALYFANGYTSGDRSLAGQIIANAGFSNVALEHGYEFGGVMPLEILAMSTPDLVVTGGQYPGNSRSESILNHPVVEALTFEATEATVADRDWVCGTPYVLRAIESLAEERREMQSSKATE